MKLSEFDYNLPPELIAQSPAPQREQSRLLVVDRNNSKLEHSKFANIGNYLPQDSLLVLNDTKVIPARLMATKTKTGGKLELLLVHKLPDNSKTEVWEALIKGKAKTGASLRIQDKLYGKIIEHKDNGHWLVEFSYEGNWNEILQEIGQVPLPPYIKGSRPDDLQRYQTVYARNPGAVAAPTAGLHFTPTLLEQLQQSGIDIAWVTLNVGPGTFAPVRVDNIKDHRMGAEYYSIPESSIELIRQAKQTGRKIVSVGTTTTRSLESSGNENGNIDKPEGWTDIFIYPGYRFKIIDCLLTNFHLPGSTPLIMTCAFAGKPLIMKAYQEAIQEKYRFYSYGDAMLVL